MHAWATPAPNENDIGSKYFASLRIVFWWYGI